MYLFRRGDWFSVVALGAVVLLLAFFRFFPLKGGAWTLVVEGVDGVVEQQVESYRKIFAPYERKTLEMEGPLGITLVLIQDGQAWVAYSPCADKACLSAGKIPGDTNIIVCEANAVTLRMKE